MKKSFQSKGCTIRKETQQNCCHPFMIFFHPDYTVGFGIAPNHALRLVGFTTGRDSHPALKISCLLFFYYTTPSTFVNRLFASSRFPFELIFRTAPLAAFFLDPGGWKHRQMAYHNMDRQAVPVNREVCRKKHQPILILA